MDPAQFEPSQATTVGRLLYFASKGEVENVKKVLDDFPEMAVDSQDYDGRTAMHLAASEGHSDVIKLLLKRTANVNPVDRWRKTPLADARRYEAQKGNKRERYQEVCNLLVTNGGSTSSPFEIDPAELKNIRDSQWNFGEIKLANWRGTIVQARIITRGVEAHSPKSDQAKLTKQLSLLQRLRHPNIVQFLGAVQTKGQLVLVTEYLQNGNLYDLLSNKKKGRIPQKEAMNYALDIARGMNYLHQHKQETVVHCDLNPMNLLRDAGGHLKVAGLHLSEIEWICSNEELNHSRKLDFARYRAPELAHTTNKTPDASVDVYSFGVIVREMFEGQSLASRQAQMGRASRQMKVLYPSELEQLLKTCCHPDSRSRPGFEKIIGKLETIREAMIKKPWCCSLQNLKEHLVIHLKSCLRQANWLPRSSSTVCSVESQKGNKLNATCASDHTICTPIPE